ncbi:hypothetical protein [Cerasicoccus frondis]|uniref:hypothetical protein n=1 Tax=Cerasicoccus frondis TaxID=490090 RepID=UPI002852A147|nr:hypothetical protein [Cerasicoccus frondis]
MALEENVPLPKINKIPFIVFDVVLLLFAAVIVFRSEWPLSPLMFMGSLFLVAMGGVVACLPFYIEFRTLAKLKEYDLSQANDENARRIEQALYGIQEIGESVIQSTDRNAEIAGAFETLLERMESRIKEIKAAPASVGGVDPEQLKEALSEQFESVRDEFAQAIMEQVAVNSDQQFNKLNSALSKLQGLPMQVSLLGDLANRYQSLVATIQDTAAQLVESTPVSQPKAESPIPEDSLDGVIEESVEENVAPEAPNYGMIELRGAPEVDSEKFDQMDARFEAEIAKEKAEREAAALAAAEELADTEAVEELEEEAPEAVEDEPEDMESVAAVEVEEAEAEETEELDEAESAEDFGELDARYEDELDDDDEYEEADEAHDDAEPEFLTEADLADEDEEAEPEEDEALIAEASEAEEEAPEAEAAFEPEELYEESEEAMPEMSAEALAELEEEEFDIALSDDDEIVAEEEAPEAPEEAAVAESEAAEVVDEEASGMGFDDWDEFGEIASAEDEEAAPADPEQGELIGDLPDSPKSKPKKQRGATTLIAQVLIGIGNKPYVRGTGPGLSEDEGVPMEFLEIGKWQWTAPSSDEPVTVRIYKNDEDPAEGDPVEIPAGQRRSVAPKFPS